MKHLYALLFFLQSSFLFAQPGTLDNSFGVFGVALYTFFVPVNHGEALALQADGKILVAGHLIDTTYDKAFVIRLTSSGTADPGFNQFISDASIGNEYARAVAVQSDGKIVLAGHVAAVDSDFLVIRLLSNGDLDSTFGTNGAVIAGFSPGSIDETNDLVIQPDGKILIAGWTRTVDKDVAVLRFNSDGSPDSTFGVNGKVATDISGNFEEAHSIKLLPGGRIVVAGFSSSPFTAQDVMVARYQSDGTIDSSFDADGIALLNINSDDEAALDMEVQPDGKIVTAGYAYSVFTYADNLLVRFDTTGALDTSFNGTGYAVSNNTNSDQIAYDVMLQPDGKIVITGRAFISSNFNIHLERFHSNGSVDLSFGTSGHVFTPIGIEDDFSFAGLLQPDGKIVVTGYYTDSGLENLYVARYLNDISTSAGENIAQPGYLYPQPASDVLHIRLNNNVSSGATASVYSVTSELVQTVNASNDFSIDVSKLPAGMYFLRITGSDNRVLAANKFVVN
jgi:uncharacterized delta-60 repeat protein